MEERDGDGRRESVLEEVCGQLEAQRLPHWEELPDLELYMDQVLSLVGRYLGDYPGFDRKGLTASMVNNYVKTGLLPPPVRKKYNRGHVARLVVICVLKSVLPIAKIGKLFDRGADGEDGSGFRAFYEDVVAGFEDGVGKTAAEYRLPDADGGEASPPQLLCRAALRAQAEQALVLRLSEVLFRSG